ncbi:MAG: glycosyltransferase family protein [Candidatus Micrarchaeia archaeon]
MRVFLSACGEGLGHSSRTLALYNELKGRGHDVVAASYGMALKRLRAAGARTIQTRPEVLMTGADGRFDLVGSIIRSRGTPLDVAKAFLAERAFIRSFDADVVVSDARFATVLAAFAQHVPVFYITNQTHFILTGAEERQKGRTLLARVFSAQELERSVLESIIEVPLSLPYPFAQEIVIPDFLPPDTICAPLLSNDPRVRGKTRFVGPLSVLASRPPPVHRPSKTPRVLVTLGGQAFRAGEFDRLLGVLRRMTDFNFTVVSIFAKKRARAGNVRVRPFVRDIFPLMSAADLLVMPAGHSAIMESILLCKPALLLPDAQWPEQESNAVVYERLGLGLRSSPLELHLLPAKLRELRERREEFVPRLRRLSLEARGAQNGARNAAELCESAAT